jgi:hypothetical protein
MEQGGLPGLVLVRLRRLMKAVSRPGASFRGCPPLPENARGSDARPSLRPGDARPALAVNQDSPNREHW